MPFVPPVYKPASQARSSPATLPPRSGAMKPAVPVVQRAVHRAPTQPVAQRKPAAPPHPHLPHRPAPQPAPRQPARTGGVIQRDVGFEFEVDEVTTFRKKFFGGTEPLKKKDVLLARPGLFKVEADVREDQTSDMEIVTEAFPESREGGMRLAQAMNEITALCSRLVALNQPAHRVISAAELSAFGAPVGNRYLTAKGGGAFFQLTAKPQVTAGIRLNRLMRLLTDIERAPIAGGSAARLAIGGANPMAPLTAGSPTIAAGRVAADAAIGAMAADFARVEPHSGAFGSQALRALLALVATYLAEGQRGVGGYAKTIANPLMARTDFATMYQQLPLAERRYFGRTRHRDTWLDLALDAGARAAGVANLNADNAVFEGRLYNDVVMYGPSLMRPVADPRFNTDVLPELKRRQWINGMAFDRKDYLTQKHYPGSKAKKAELESLGSYGNKMDVAAGSAARDAPIFEFRGLDSKRYVEWYSFALAFLRYVRAVNTGNLAEDYADTLDAQVIANLLGVGGAGPLGRTPAVERTRQINLHMAPVLQW